MRDRPQPTSPTQPATIPRPNTPPDRLIGAFPPPHIRTNGPNLIVTAAIHGNEPAGISAARNLLRTLRSRADPHAFNGRVTALIGNTRAYARNARYIHEDLNRHWTPRQLRRIDNLIASAQSNEHAPLLAEDRELIDLRSTILDTCDATLSLHYLIDLHTTSAPTHPFVYTEDCTATRKFARALPIITCLGGEPHLKGLLADWFNENLGPALVYESASHDNPDAAARHEAALWLLLDHLRMPRTRTLTAYIKQARSLLRTINAQDPQLLEIRHRHPVAEGDRFRMKPGYTNFQRVPTGEHLADDKRGPILAPRNGRIFMPLYQPLGEDGFFITTRMSNAFVLVSNLARKGQLRKAAHLLPGVERIASNNHPQLDALAANPRIARMFRRQIFALLGYRRTKHVGHRVIFARTPTDLHHAIEEYRRPE